jgi:hypothetical protein
MLRCRRHSRHEPWSSSVTCCPQVAHAPTPRYFFRQDLQPEHSQPLVRVTPQAWQSGQASTMTRVGASGLSDPDLHTGDRSPGAWVWQRAHSPEV